MDMVLPALYLGCAGAEQQYDELRRRGVTHVLQVRMCSHASGIAPVTSARRGVHCTMQHADTVIDTVDPASAVHAWLPILSNHPAQCCWYSCLVS
jgi:hypothetical protein